MPPSVSIDMFDDSIDFSGFKTAAASKTNGIRVTTQSLPSPKTLLLAPPSIASHEEKLRAVFATYDRSTSDLQMLDRVAAGLVTLAPASYDLALVLTDADGSYRTEALQLLRRSAYTALVPSLKVGAKLQLQDGSRLQGAEAREAILAGLVEKDGVFEKTEAEEAEVVVPLRFGAKKKAPPASVATVDVATKNGTANGLSRGPVVTLDLDDYNDGDELVDEDDLLTEEERNRPPQQREFLPPVIYPCEPISLATPVSPVSPVSLILHTVTDWYRHYSAPVQCGRSEAAPAVQGLHVRPR